ncbi:activating enzyme E1 catalytic subunit [Seminavis robusta]|uniref:NEDD8-activating enzyme E1 catalytic subunit n=1 Tax=Seminavis robusta TaxID=568900 RepID=A0A9N8H3J2_9STRA|nr:activating enzyme E1 catalytic subunit [Seminavis robusta]|eukprot:Sro88_g046680.1 activating enzyme E1 catalytic subunit (470) ;mRNA; f:98598-100196
MDTMPEKKRSRDDMIDETKETGESMDIDFSDGGARRDLMTLLSRASPFGNENGELPIGEFEPLSKIGSNVVASDLAESPLSKAKVLVVGAGGLGCELLKNLALSGISNIHVIDLDNIDITNLNRQFLFRMKDVGKSKAEVAANFINTRCPWMKVTPYHGKIQDKGPSFYASFNCIISGLDNIEARRWLNATVCGLVELDSDGDPDPSTIIPIVDGGTEGFNGQARIIIPRISSCFECSLSAFPPQTSFPLCTIAETPRRPEHCIAYAFILQWPKEFPDKKLDKDSPEDMQWVYECAAERAKKYNIEGVTLMMTMGVVKNIIPAVASTNAIVSAACTNEVVKLLSFCSQTLNSYMMYMGTQSVYSHTFIYEKLEACPVCSSQVQKLTVSKSMTVNGLIQQLCSGDLRLKAPSMTSAGGSTIYMQKPPALEKATRPNLDKPLSALIESGEELTVTDPVLEHVSVTVRVTFE